MQIHLTSLDQYLSPMNYFKIISCILVNRLNPIIGSLVGSTQSAFIPGRSIVDNIHQAQDLLNKFHINVGRSCM